MTKPWISTRRDRDSKKYKKLHAALRGDIRKSTSAPVNGTGAALIITPSGTVFDPHPTSKAQRHKKASAEYRQCGGG